MNVERSVKFRCTKEEKAEGTVNKEVVQDTRLGRESRSVWGNSGFMLQVIVGIG